MTEGQLVMLYEKLHKILGNDTPRKQAEWLMKNRLVVYIIEHLYELKCEELDEWLKTLSPAEQAEWYKTKKEVVDELIEHLEQITGE